MRYVLHEFKFRPANNSQAIFEKGHGKQTVPKHGLLQKLEYN